MIKWASRAESFWKGFGSLSKGVQEGYRRAARTAGGGLDNLLLTLGEWPAKKVFGKKRVEDTLWKVHRQALSADMLAGQIPDALTKRLPKGFGSELFKQRDLVPIGKGLHKEVKRTSLLAPAVKARDIAVPLIAGVTLEKELRKLRSKERPQETHGT